MVDSKMTANRSELAFNIVHVYYTYKMCLKQYEDVCSRHVEEATQGVISVHIQARGVSMSTCGNIIGKRLTRIKSCRYILLAQAIECTSKTNRLCFR